VTKRGRSLSAASRSFIETLRRALKKG
jgi:hypothetical protein